MIQRFSDENLSKFATIHADDLCDKAYESALESYFFLKKIQQYLQINFTFLEAFGCFDRIFPCFLASPFTKKIERIIIEISCFY